MVDAYAAATCHTGGQNVIESEKTLERDALIEYLDGGFSTASIERQVTLHNILTSCPSRAIFDVHVPQHCRRMCHSHQWRTRVAPAFRQAADAALTRARLLHLPSCLGGGHRQLHGCCVQ